jgi:hypothetical protein
MDHFFLPHGDEICWMGDYSSPDLARFRLWDRQRSQLGDKWGTVADGERRKTGRAEERMSGLASVTDLLFRKILFSGDKHRLSVVRRGMEEMKDRN